ncbi:hypothetical protein AB0O61_02090 [Streptomyces bungoensis]
MTNSGAGNAPVLGVRAPGRATLARRLLLGRSSLSVLDAVRHAPRSTPTPPTAA